MDREIISDTIYAVFSLVVSVVGMSTRPFGQRLRLLSDPFPVALKDLLCWI